MYQNIQRLFTWPEFYTIPGFSNYGISPQGDVFSLRTWTVLSGSINSAGYCHYRIQNDNGSVITMGRHRLLCLTFKSISMDPSNMVVNHKNGIKGDDRLENLEWTTPKANVEHAGSIGISPKCCPIEMRDVDTGEVVYFPSMLACANAIGFSKDAVAWRVHSEEHRVFPERKQYRLSSDQVWITPEDTDRSIATYGVSKGVQVRNVLTAEVSEYPRMQDAATALGVAPSVISDWVSRSNQPVLPGCIQIKRSCDPSPWRQVEDPYLELNHTSGRRVVQVINAQSEHVQTFTSAAECAREMGISTTALNYRLKTNGQKVFSDGYKYRYYSFQ